MASAGAVRNHSQSLGDLMPEERLHYQTKKLRDPAGNLS